MMSPVLSLTLKMAAIAEAVKTIENNRLILSGVGKVYVAEQEVDGFNRFKFIHLLEEFFIYSARSYVLKYQVTGSASEVSKMTRQRRLDACRLIAPLYKKILGVSTDDWNNKQWLIANKDEPSHYRWLHEQLIVHAKQHFTKELTLFSVLFNADFIECLNNVYYDLNDSSATTKECTVEYEAVQKTGGKNKGLDLEVKVATDVTYSPQLEYTINTLLK